MENASKALIIAGAILLAILLISLGIMIYNQAQNTVNNSGMSQAEIQAFNNRFLKYEGTQTGSVVKSLVNEVIAAKQDPTTPSTFSARQNSATGTEITTTSMISDKNTYTVAMNYGTDGHVSAIIITGTFVTP